MNRTERRNQDRETTHQLFSLGRELAWALAGTLKPTAQEMKEAATKLRITQKQAWQAWSAFTWS